MLAALQSLVRFGLVACGRDRLGPDPISTADRKNAASSPKQVCLLCAIIAVRHQM